MSRQDKIGKHKTMMYKDNDYLCIKYHNTDVVKFNDLEIILNHGGWLTNTTKTRMNQAAWQYDLDYRVYQEDFVWFVLFQDKKHLFDDNKLTLKR